MLIQRALLKEIQELRRQVDQIQRQQQRPLMRHGWLSHIIHDLEYNPDTQYKVHLYAAVYWILNLPVVLFLFFVFPDIWLQVGLLVTLVYSLYANFATDYGAMSAALAAHNQNPLPELPIEQHVQIKEKE